MSTAGPAGWNPTPGAVGLARVRSSVPFWLKTRMSGVNGLVELKVPPTMGEVWSLHTLGRPCPDSRTYTSKSFALPLKAIPVGKFKPERKTETVNPGGTTISLPVSGLNNAVLFVQIGFATVAAPAAIGDIRNGAI